MNKRGFVISFIIFVALFVVGFVVGYRFADDGNDFTELESSLAEKDLEIAGMREQLELSGGGGQESVYTCQNDADCRLEVAGCLLCDDCGSHSINGPEVIAVNKDLYICPDKPDGTICTACVNTYDYNAEEDAICINNRCEKRFTL
jgi:hypothetical protein